MKTQERDELLIRLDERTANIYTLTEKQEKHLAELNATVARNTTTGAVNRRTIRIIYSAFGTIFGGGGLTYLILWLTGVLG